jgi:hypothetical protein
MRHHSDGTSFRNLFPNLFPLSGNLFRGGTSSGQDSGGEAGPVLMKIDVEVKPVK